MFTALRVFASRFASLRRRTKDREEFDAEYESHLQLAAEDFRRAGYLPAEARRMAVLALGHRESLYAGLRERQSYLAIESLLHDIHVGARGLSRRRWVAVASILPIATSIASLFVFQQANRELHNRPQPFPNSESIAAIWRDDRGGLFSALEFERLRLPAGAFDSVGVFDVQPRNYSYGEGVRAEQVFGLHVSPRVFDAFGVPPLFGGIFHEGSGIRTVVLSHGLWVRHHGATFEKDMRLSIDGEIYTIAGVMPPGFRFDSPLGAVEMWLPVARDNIYFNQSYRSFGGIGRLRPGASFTEVRRTVPITRLSGYGDAQLSGVFDSATEAAWILLAISSISAAVLLSASGNSRGPTLWLLRTLGAGGARIGGQLILEAVMVVLAAVAVGWTVFRAAVWAHDSSALALFVSSTALGEMRSAASVGDLFAAGCFALAIVGAVRLTGLRSAGGANLRAGLLACAVALGSPVLAIAFAHIETLTRIAFRGVGIEPSNVYTGRILARSPFGSHGFCESITSRLRAVPGVVKVSAANRLPIGTNDFVWTYSAVDTAPMRDTALTVVCPGLFHSLGMPILTGRDFRLSDGPSSRPVVIVNEALVRASGAVRFLTLGGGEIAEVVGVVRDAGDARSDVPALPHIYRPHSQMAWRAMTVVVKTDGSPISAKRLQGAMAMGDSPQALPPIRPMAPILDKSLRPFRIRTALLGGLGALTLIVLSACAFGVIRPGIRERRREIAIRIALGAGALTVAKLLLVRFRAWGLGAASAGAALTWIIGRDLPAMRPGPFVLAAATLAALVVLAILLPSWRMTRSGIAAALRAE